MKEAKEVAFDLENTAIGKNAQWVGLGFAWKEDGIIQSCYIPVGHLEEAPQIRIDVVKGYVEEIFDNCIVEVFNADHELKETRKYKLTIKDCYDVRIDFVAANELHFRDSLKDGAKKFLGLEWGTLRDICEKRVQVEGKNGKKVWKKILDVAGSPIKDLGEYCMMDCIATILLKDYLKPHITYCPTILKLERAVTPVVVDMEERGIRVDLEAAERRYGRSKEILASLEHHIYGAAGEVFNINSTQQLAVILYENLGLPRPTGRRDGNDNSTDVEALEGLFGEHPLIDLMLKYRGEKKLQSTYILPILTQHINGRIYPSLNQLGTESGRFSSSGGYDITGERLKGLNLQTLPRPKRDKKTKLFTEDDPGIRQLFVASEGMVLIDFDFSQIEGRVFAHVSQDQTLLDYYLNGGDIHTATAEKLEIDRTLAKTINFAIIYGATPKKLSTTMLKEGYKYSTRDAKELIEDFWNLYSGGAKWKDRLLEELYATKQVFTIDGRRRMFPEIRRVPMYLDNRQYNPEFSRMSAMEREAINFAVQGSAADIMKKAMVDVSYALKSANNAAHLLLQVHDELLSEAYPENIDLAMMLIAHRMADCTILSLPLGVEGKTGENWAEVH